MFARRQTEQSQEHQTDPVFSPEWITSEGRILSIKQEDFLTFLPEESFYDKTTQSRQEQLRLILSNHPANLLHRNNSSLFEASLPSLCTELHCSRSSAGFSPWFIDFTEIFNTKSTAGAVSEFLTPWSSVFLGQQTLEFSQTDGGNVGIWKKCRPDKVKECNCCVWRRDVISTPSFSLDNTSHVTFYFTTNWIKIK